MKEPYLVPQNKTSLYFTVFFLRKNHNLLFLTAFSKRVN